MQMDPVALYLEALRRYYNWPYYGFACENYISARHLLQNQLLVSQGQQMLRQNTHQAKTRRLL